MPEGQVVSKPVTRSRYMERCDEKDILYTRSSAYIIHATTWKEFNTETKQHTFHREINSNAINYMHSPSQQQCHWLDRNADRISTNKTQFSHTSDSTPLLARLSRTSVTTCPTTMTVTTNAM